MFSGLPCESHIAHIAHIARARGTVRVRPPSHTDHTDHTVIRSYGGLALRHPAAPALPAAPPDRVFLPLTRPSVNPGVGTGLPLQSWRGHRIARKTHHRAIAEGVSAMPSSQHR